MRRIYEVHPKFPVLHTVYTVVASSFDEAAERVLTIENANDADCGGITMIDVVSDYDAEAPSYIGFGEAK